MKMIDRAIIDLATRQHGVLARGQLIDKAGADDAIRRRLRAGRLERCLPGVYRTPGAPEGHMQRLWIGHLAAGPRSVVSHEAAAALHHFPGHPREAVVLTLPHPEHARIPDVTVHQISDLDRRWVWELDGLPVTTSARTVVDLAATTGRARLERILDDGLTSGRLQRGAVAACLFAVLRPGKRGLVKLADLLDARGPGHVPPASELERLLFTALEGAGLPAPTRQYALPGREGIDGRVDAAYPEAKLILEADGRRWHTRRADFARDRARDRQAARVGWLTLRFTWEELRDDPSDAAATVAEVREERLTLLSRQ